MTYLMAFLCLLSEEFRNETVLTINLSDFEVYSEGPFAVSDSGVIAVLLDAQEKQILFISPSGQLLGRCGRSGQGPGEFNSPDEISYLPEESVFAVYDSGKSQFTKWSLAGELVVTLPFTPRPYLPKFQPDGSIIYATKLSYVSALDGGEVAAPSLIRQELTAPVGQGIWTYSGALHTVPVLKVEADLVMPITTPWDPKLHVGYGSNFIAVAFGSDPQLHILSLGGKQIGAAVEISMKQPAVQDQEIDAFIDQSFRVVQAKMRQQQEALFANTSWPPICGLFVDSQDRIWVIGPQLANTGTSQVAIYETTGKTIARGTLPGTPRFLKDDQCYGFVSNEMGDVCLTITKITF